MRLDRTIASGIGAASLLNQQVFATNFLDHDSLLAGVEDPAWFEENVPILDIPEEQIRIVYYYRWQTWREHLFYTGPQRYAAPRGGIVAAAGQHINEGRWLRDRKPGQDIVNYDVTICLRSHWTDVGDIVARWTRTVRIACYRGRQPEYIYLDETLIVNSLVSADWEYFGLENVAYHGHNVTVLWDETGTHYDQGLRVWVNDQSAGNRADLGALTITIPPPNVQPISDLVNIAASSLNLLQGPQANASFSTTIGGDNFTHGIDGSIFRRKFRTLL
ncbi:hypothetical protein CLAFUW4_07431 [Fulvia fulva]|nr:hypothetical protein CLAFUR4_07438 [Fulvia fulva]WPV16100.1 hypothetical protein CLAFUW4_07431 [Fulvia fulva]